MIGVPDIPYLSHTTRLVLSGSQYHIMQVQLLLRKYPSDDSMGFNQPVSLDMSLCQRLIVSLLTVCASKNLLQMWTRLDQISQAVCFVQVQTDHAKRSKSITDIVASLVACPMLENQG